MGTVLLVIHVLVALALVVIILVQRSEGGGLGMGAANSASSFMSVRGTANLLTKTTATLAGLFIATSLALAILAGNHGQGTSILDDLPAQPPLPAAGAAAPAQTTGVPLQAVPQPAAPHAAPAPAVPLSR